MDLIKRARDRKTVTPIVEVVLEELTFGVQRFSQREMNSASRRAAAIMREQGIDPELAEQGHRLAALCMGISEIVQRHIKSWEHKPLDQEPPLVFSAKALEELSESFTDVERVTIGAAYLMAITQETEQKKTANEALLPSL